MTRNANTEDAMATKPNFVLIYAGLYAHLPASHCDTMEQVLDLLHLACDLDSPIEVDPYEIHRYGTGWGRSLLVICNEDGDRVAVISRNNTETLRTWGNGTTPWINM